MGTKDAADGATLEPLLREHAALRADLDGTLRRLGSAAADPETGHGLETRAATLVRQVLAHLDGIVDEAMRRGVDPRDLEDAWARVAGSGASLAIQAAFGAAHLGPQAGSVVAALRRGADAGRPDAAYVLAQCLALAPKPPEDEIRSLLERAAAAGHAGAMVALADRIANAERGASPRVVDLWRRAADLGDGDAHWRLANLTVGGGGSSVPKDVPQALRHLERAAEAGHPEAQLELGRVYAAGASGVDVDHAAAKRWLERAAAQHRRMAQEWLDRYGALTPREYASASWLAAWTPDELPPAARPRPLGIAVALAVLVLVVWAAAEGSSMGLFLLFLFLAVLLHEAGHLAAARLVGVPIAVFSVGVGPTVKSFVLKGRGLPLRVDVGLLPLLGSVRPYVMPRGVFRHWTAAQRARAAGRPAPPLPDFDRAEEPEPAFRHVSRPRQLAFQFGGLGVNLLAGVLCLWGYEQASPVARLVTSPVVQEVPEDSVAAAAGLLPGDRFVAVGGEAVRGFYDVQRRLAPVDAQGRALPPRDPPGSAVALDVLRDGATVRLTWTMPDTPPAEDAAERYGLLAPRTWRVARVQLPPGGPRERVSAPELAPGDEVRAFEGPLGAARATDAGAQALLRQTFAAAGERAVRLTVVRHGSERVADVAPLREPRPDGSRVPFELAPLREEGEPDGLAEVVPNVFRVGYGAVASIPQDVVASFAKAPTKEERGWLLEEVRRDPWAALRTFALIHAVLFFFNLLPIPPLDGFHVVRTLVEAALRRDLPQGGVRVLLRVGWFVLAAWLAFNALLVLRDLGAAVL